MNWQEIISLIIVAIALLLIVRSEIRKYQLRKSRPCGADCPCTVRRITFLSQPEQK